MPKNIKCKHCDKLKNHWCRAVLDSPDEDIERDCRHFRHKTNADRIRAMSDEELADFLTDKQKGWCTEIGREMYYQNNMEWLKQPVENDDDK